MVSTSIQLPQLTIITCVLLFLGNINIAFTANPNDIPLDYVLDDGGSVYISVGTSWPQVITMFNKEEFQIKANLSWKSVEPSPSSNIVRWVTNFDGTDIDSGEISLTSSLSLPTKIDVGKATANSSGSHTITVTLYLDDTVTKIQRKYQSIPSAVSVIPIIVVMILSIVKHKPTLAIGTGVLIGSFIITGDIVSGFKYAITNIIVVALINPQHVSVFAFCATFSGLIALMDRSGGIEGFARLLSKYVKSSKSAQVVVFIMGVCFFFDSYSSILTVGGLCYPITDRIFISREKLSFLVDSTCSLVISLMPLSKWMTFISNFLQEQLDDMKKLQENDAYIPEGLPSSGIEVFLQTIKYRYYPIFMLIFIPVLIISGRDFGPMLIAERKVFIYGRTDGGEGRDLTDERSNNELFIKPKHDTPKMWHNMAIPIILLITFLLVGTMKSGSNGEPDQSIADKISNADSNTTILIGTVSTSICVIPLYLLQFVKDGMMYFPTFNVLKKIWIKYLYPPTTVEEASEYPRQLISMGECTNAFINGISRVYSFFTLLTLAWSIASVTTQIGLDRLFATSIANKFDRRGLPTFAYLLSCAMSLATGTSFGTMTIMLALVTKTTWVASNGDLDLFYLTIASVLSGSIFGDHVSPISDTTLLSSYACRCGHMEHVTTQAPYAIVPGLLALLCGTLPVGFKVYSNTVAYIVGLASIVVLIFLLGVKLVNKGGRYDIFTEFSMLLVRRPTLMALKRDTSMVDSSY